MLKEIVLAVQGERISGIVISENISFILALALPRYGVSQNVVKEQIVGTRL